MRCAFILRALGPEYCCKLMTGPLTNEIRVAPIKWALFGSRVSSEARAALTEISFEDIHDRLPARVFRVDMDPAGLSLARVAPNQVTPQVCLISVIFLSSIVLYSPVVT
jgi:hypothetical protein